MLSKKLNQLLNQQVELESVSSNTYLAMASWADIKGYQGVATFLYKHADEERMHMLKLFKFINERGGEAKVPIQKEIKHDYKSINEIFELIYKHETKVSQEINKLVDNCLSEKDYATHNFLQWYVSEQIEEERLARTIIDKLQLIGNDKGGLYLFDRDLNSLTGGEEEGK
jgi:ferritin